VGYTQISPVPFILFITGLVTFATGQNDSIYTTCCGCAYILGMWFTLYKITGAEQLLVQAGSIFLGYIVPGILLWRNAKQERHVQTA
jgi:hypothetical protein